MGGNNYTNEKKVYPPRMVTMIRHGVHPRFISRVLVNKKTAPSFEQLLNTFTTSLKPVWGAVRHIYRMDGSQVSKYCTQ